VFLQFQLHTCTYQNYLEEPPNPRETSARINFNVIDKKTIDLYFIKKMSQNVWAIIMPFGPVTKFFTGPKKKFRASLRLAIISGTV
jgi:hypothetical protein